MIAHLNYSVNASKIWKAYIIAAVPYENSNRCNEFMVLEFNVSNMYHIYLFLIFHLLKKKTIFLGNVLQWCWNRGAGGQLSPPRPIFGRSVNPIPTGEGRLSPPITTGNVFHLPASLQIIPHFKRNSWYRFWNS